MVTSYCHDLLGYIFLSQRRGSCLINSKAGGKTNALAYSSLTVRYDVVQSRVTAVLVE